MCTRNTCGPACFYLILQTGWAALILILAIAKIGAYGAEGFLEHFTNWSWALQGLFYASTLAFIVPSRPGRCIDVRCAGHVVALCFLPLNTIVWFVAVAVFVLLVTDPEFITDLFDAMGAGVVIVGNDVFHTLPVLALVMYAAVQHHLIWYGLNRWFAYVTTRISDDKSNRCCALVLLIVYQTIGGALLYAAIYFIVLAAAYGKTVNDVYGTDIPIAAGLALFVLVGLVVSGIPLLIMACWYRLFDPPAIPALVERRVYEPDLATIVNDEEFLAMLRAQEKQGRASPPPPPPPVVQSNLSFHADDIQF